MKKAVLSKLFLIFIFSNFGCKVYEEHFFQDDCNSTKYDFTRRYLIQNKQDTSRYYVIMKNDSFVYAIKDFKFGRNLTAKDSHDFISFMSQLTAYVTIDEINLTPNQDHLFYHEFFSHEPNINYVDSMLAMENELSDKVKRKLSYVLLRIKYHSVYWFYPLMYPDVCYFELNNNSCSRLRVENIVATNARCIDSVNKAKFYVDEYCYYQRNWAMTSGEDYSNLKEW